MNSQHDHAVYNCLPETSIRKYCGTFRWIGDALNQRGTKDGVNTTIQLLKLNIVYLYMILQPIGFNLPVYAENR
jgi:hypothetical protein